MKTKTKDILVKIAKELPAVVYGAGLAGIVRAMGLPTAVLALPPLLQLTQRFSPFHVHEFEQYESSLARDIWNTAKYIAGAALPYAPEVYHAIQKLV